MFTGAEGLLTFIEEKGIEAIDCHFCGLSGVIRRLTIPAGSFNPEILTEGLSFDDSSIAGFQKIHGSSMTLLPDPTNALVDPLRGSETLSTNFSIRNPLTKRPCPRDLYDIARKAKACLIFMGIAETTLSAPEAEFCVFDNIRFDSTPSASYYYIDSKVGVWNPGRVQDGGNRGYKTRCKGGYFLVTPVDHFGDLRSDIIRHTENAGLAIGHVHHECGTTGQAETSWQLDTMLESADDAMKPRYLVKNTAWEASKTVTFIPKPVFGDNGSGMHVHSSLWSDGEPLFYDENGYAGPLDMARWYIGGILKHTPALLAFTNPSASSFHRLVLGFGAPVNLVYPQHSRSVYIRIPITGSNPKVERIEFRCPDPPNDPCLTLAAILLTKLDGIQSRIEPPAPINKNLYEPPPEEYAEISAVPASLSAVLGTLEADHEFLLAGDVLTPDLITTWVGFKRAEVQAIAIRPHPHEFELYYTL